MADMHLMYGLANCNAYEARRLYAEKFPNRNLPNRKTFQRIHERLVETGSFEKRSSHCGRPISIRTPDLEERVLHHIEENNGSSTRGIAGTENVSHVTVWKILREQLLYPYHLQRVQGLSETDIPPRKAFCTWLLQMCAQDQTFLSTILFTDEAKFTRNGVQNFHNTHVWADVNPCAVLETRHQQQFSINVWAGIIGDSVIGPFIFHGTLTGASYSEFLMEHLNVLLEAVPLHLIQNMWFMHDGAPPHFSLQARAILNQRFPNKWIGRGAATSWPARSPDLNPLDFYLWGHLKNIVYSRPVANVEILRQRVEEGFQQIQQTPGIWERVRQSMMRRLEACVRANGSHFEHLL